MSTERGKICMCPAYLHKRAELVGVALMGAQNLRITSCLHWSCCICVVTLVRVCLVMRGLLLLLPEEGALVLQGQPHSVMLNSLRWPGYSGATMGR